MTKIDISKVKAGDQDNPLEWASLFCHDRWLRVSRDGQVYSCAFTNRRGSKIPAKRLRPQIAPHGYMKIQIASPISGKLRSYYIHRLIMEAYTGRNLKGLEVDHVNGRRDDNRIANLRICTKSQNSMNRAPLGGRSIFKGVFKCQNREAKNWVARIWKDGRSFTVGYFDDEKEAAHAYNQKALELYGQFAYLNDLDPGDRYVELPKCCAEEGNA